MWFWRLKSWDYKKSITLAASEATHLVTQDDRNIQSGYLLESEEKDVFCLLSYIFV